MTKVGAYADSEVDSTHVVLEFPNSILIMLRSEKPTNSRCVNTDLTPVSNSVLNASTRSLLRIFENRGYSLLKLASLSRFPVREVFVPQSRIDKDEMYSIWQMVYERSDESIGLAAAVSIPLGAYGILDGMLLASPTLGDVCRSLKDYFSIVNGSGSVSVDRFKGHVSIELTNSPETPEEHVRRSAEYTFAVILQRIQLAAKQIRLRPIRIDFGYPRPSECSNYERVFKTYLQYDQSTNRIIFDAEFMTVPLPNADGAMLEKLQDQANRIMDGSRPVNDLIARVRQVLCCRVIRGDVSLSATAREIAKSDRDLQRKLNECGTSYQSVLDQLRCELALDYLSQKLDRREVAYRLGFSEASAFSRAFKGWTGCSYRTIKGLIRINH